MESYVRVVETGEPLVLDDLEYADVWAGRRMERVFDVRASRLGDGLAYTWRDVTERRRAERRRATDLERRVRERTAELEAAQSRALALAELSAAMLEAASPAQVAQRLLAAAGRASGIREGLVGLVERETGSLTILATIGHAMEQARAFAALPATTASPVRDVVETGQPRVIEDSASLARRYPELASEIAALGDRSLVVFPLRIGESAIGAVSLGFTPRGFDDSDLTFFESLANAAAHALERLRLADAEREARGMLDAVVAQMPVGVSIVGPGRRVLYRNESLERIFGRSGQEADRQAEPAEPLAAFRTDGTRYGTEDWPGSRSLATGEVVVNEEIHLVRADGANRAVLQTSAPVRDAAGEIAGAVVISIDVTARRESEQLRDAFLGVLSHELRTPVTTIYGGAKVLAGRGQRLDPGIRDELAADVAAEAERLARLVDDLLVLARAERGVDLSARGPALVQHRLRAIVAALAAEWPDREWACEIPDQVPPVTGDEAYVEQVLRNLLGNAAKYGRHRIEVRLTTLEDAVEVAVLDDGPGVDPAERERIFDLFWRSRASQDVPGAGIGLFVARRLVEAMGGELAVANRPEGGAAFSLRLPQFRESDV